MKCAQPCDTIENIMSTDDGNLEYAMKTKRLLIRPYQASDLHQFLMIAKENDIGIIKASTSPDTSRFLAERWIENIRSSMSAGVAYEFAVIETNTQLLIGTAGLISVDRVRLVGEFGIWISAAFRHNGYATEAAQAVLDFAFKTLQLRRISARSDGDNEASIRLLQNLGFKPSVGLRRQLARDSVYENVIHWELHTETNTV